MKYSTQVNKHLMISKDCIINHFSTLPKCFVSRFMCFRCVLKYFSVISSNRIHGSKDGLNSLIFKRVVLLFTEIFMI